MNLLTIDELCNELKVTRNWVYSKTRKTGPDAIPRLKVGKYLRFPREEIFEWLRHNTESERVRHI
jgi:excisionase family DNA binding protein